jgi:hypothetical protein
LVVLGDICPIGQSIELAVCELKPFSELEKGFGKNIQIIGNLECSFTTSDSGIPLKWANLKASPQVVSTLEGLSLAVLANNHIADFGSQGLHETISLLERNGIKHVGYGRNLDEALRTQFLQLGERKLGVVALNCPTTNSENLATHLTGGVAPLGMENLRRAVQSAKSQCDALLVYLHWGCEWVHDPVPDQLRMARLAINSGADAVVGCHSHTIQSYEQYKGRWIFYGLGNFLFGSGEAKEAKPDGTIVRHPLRLEPSNRESLAVSFSIQPDTGGGRLKLDQIQPMAFGDDWIPKPIGAEALSFDLQDANKKLAIYAERQQSALEQTEEPAFISKFRNGVLAYWYSQDPITITIAQKEKDESEKKPPGNRQRFVSRIRGAINPWLEKKRLSLRIRSKWRKDARHLPLTPEHWELYNIIHRLCWRELHDFPNLIQCRDFNDRIQWLKLFDQHEAMARCSDKILVRDYIRERIGDKYLVRLYQVRARFEEINFDALPNQFVIKTNHDSGTVILVRDKNKWDKASAATRIQNSLKQTYGWLNGEWAYAFVKPAILIEEFIEPERTAPPPDYKFYVVEGKVRFVHFIYDRGADTKEQTVDRDGNDLATELYPSFKLGAAFRKPECWPEMLDVAERLGKGFKCVRVDLFCSNNRIYAGEMTFWPMFGCYKGEGQKKLGPLLDFDRSTFQPPIYHRAKSSCQK